MDASYYIGPLVFLGVKVCYTIVLSFGVTMTALQCILPWGTTSQPWYGNDHGRFSTFVIHHMDKHSKWSILAE